MRVASRTARWTSTIVSDEHVPARWGHLDATADTLSLKDTRHTHWPNTLVRPDLYHYLFPRAPRRDWESALVDDIVTRVQQATVPLRVRLFCTPGSRNEYYGEWVVSELLAVTPERYRLTLRRLAEQAPLAAPATKFRSRNEERHYDVLVRELRGWRVEHEPETLRLDLHEPTVRHGVAQDDACRSRSYTCDFVAARGACRLCIESKPTREHVTPEAWAKCERLRDRTLTRVVLMAGDADDIEWLDFGCPVDPTPTWYADLPTLLDALGV
jgi:hypothetical protein